MYVNILVTNYNEEETVLSYLKDVIEKLNGYEFKLNIVISSASTIASSYFDELRKYNNVNDVIIVHVADSKLWTGQVVAGLNALHSNLSYGVTVVSNTDQLIEIGETNEFRSEIELVAKQSLGLLPDVLSTDGNVAYSRSETCCGNAVLYGPCRFFIFNFSSEFYRAISDIESIAPHYCGDLLFTLRYGKLNRLSRMESLIVYSNLENSGRFGNYSFVQNFSNRKSLYNLHSLHYFNRERLVGLLILLYPFFMMRMILKGVLFWLYRRYK